MLPWLLLLLGCCSSFAVCKSHLILQELQLLQHLQGATKHVLEVQDTCIQHSRKVATLLDHQQAPLRGMNNSAHTLRYAAACVLTAYVTTSMTCSAEGFINNSNWWEQQLHAAAPLHLHLLTCALSSALASMGAGASAVQHFKLCSCTLLPAASCASSAFKRASEAQLPAKAPGAADAADAGRCLARGASAAGASSPAALLT